MSCSAGSPSGSARTAPMGTGRAGRWLAAHHERLAELLDEGLTVVKAGELLAREGVVVPERTLHRYALEVLGRGRGRKPTVRVADCEPGAECQVDFGKMGLLDDPEAGRRRVVHALIFTAVYSRHMFVWLTFRQTSAAVIAGFEAAWAFFGGVFKVVIPDNMAAIVDRAHPLEPRLNQAFVEYAQARGFVVDPARVRHPADKPRVERMVQFVRGSFFAGESFTDLPDAQRAPGPGARPGRAADPPHHPVPPGGAVRRRGAAAAAAGPVVGYDLPVYASPKVHRDHHIEVAKALYSVPGNLIGAHVDVRADSKLVRVWHRGQLVKIHPRARPGGRVTDPADLPAHTSAYAMRDIDYLQRLAAEARRRRSAPTPRRCWTTRCRGPRCARSTRCWGWSASGGRPGSRRPARRALEAEAVSVGLIGRMLERGTEGQHLPHTPPLPGLPAPRFARDSSHFAITRPPQVTSPGPGSTTVSPPPPAITGELRSLLRRVKLGRCCDTLPERLTLAAANGLSHAEFLELVLSDEVTRRDTTSADRRARAAGLDPAMRLDRWDDTAKITYDRAVWTSCSRCGSSTTATTRSSWARSGSARPSSPPPSATPPSAAATPSASNAPTSCSNGSEPARLDNSHDDEIRKLLRVDLLIVDDFALQPLDAARHRRHLRDHRRTAPRRGHHRHLQPRTRSNGSP